MAREGAGSSADAVRFVFETNRQTVTVDAVRLVPAPAVENRVCAICARLARTHRPKNSNGGSQPC